MLEFLYTGNYGKEIDVNRPQARAANPRDSREPPVKLTNTLVGTSDTVGATKWTEKHPAYLHARPYAEGDYFMIDDTTRLGWIYFSLPICQALDYEDVQSLVEEIYFKKSALSRT